MPVRSSGTFVVGIGPHGHLAIVWSLGSSGHNCFSAQSGISTQVPKSWTWPYSDESMYFAGIVSSWRCQGWWVCSSSDSLWGSSRTGDYPPRQLCVQQVCAGSMGLHDSICPQHQDVRKLPLGCVTLFCCDHMTHPKACCYCHAALGFSSWQPFTLSRAASKAFSEWMVQLYLDVAEVKEIDGQVRETGAITSTLQCPVRVKSYNLLTLPPPWFWTNNSPFDLGDNSYRKLVWLFWFLLFCFFSDIFPPSADKGGGWVMENHWLQSRPKVTLSLHWLSPSQFTILTHWENLPGSFI